MKKLNITNKIYYFISLTVILLLSIYPLIMGFRILIAYISEGQINAADYPKYVIPYTPISLSLIISVAVIPLLIKIYKKYVFLAVSVLGAGLFLFFETLFEKVTVFSVKEGNYNIGSWQAYMCYQTPEAMQAIEYKETIGQALAQRYNPAFKVHFYLIAILIVLAVIGVVCGFGKMVRDKNYDKKKPLIIQTTAVSVFIGLCIFACFTAFYRTGELNLAALSSWLMSVFFIVFGITAGAYTSSILYFKKPVFSMLLPAVIAAATAFIMYVGELILMGGVLFKFGNGFLFDPIGVCPFAPVDISVIIFSGIITYFLLFLIRFKKGDIPHDKQN